MHRLIIITFVALLSAACGGAADVQTKTATDAKDTEIARLKQERAESDHTVQLYAKVIKRYQTQTSKSADAHPTDEPAPQAETSGRELLAPKQPPATETAPEPRQLLSLPRVVAQLPPNRNGGILPVIGFTDENPCLDNSMVRALGGWDPRIRDLTGRCARIVGSRYGVLIQVDAYEMEARYVGGVPQSTCVDFRGEQRHVPMSLPGEETHYVLNPGWRTIRYHLFQESTTGECWTHVRTTVQTVSFPRPAGQYWRQFRPEQLPNG